MRREDIWIEVDGLRLACVLTEPAGSTLVDLAASALTGQPDGDGDGPLTPASEGALPAGAKAGRRPAIVICHGYPSAGRSADNAGLSYPELAERLTEALGWTALALSYRGCGRSEGDFSIDGWCRDVSGAVDMLIARGHDEVWLVGFGTGGSVCICVAGTDPRVTGVATFSAPADFDDWQRHPARLVEHSRRSGVIRSPAFPPSPEAFAAAFRACWAVDFASRIAPRPLLVVHGSEDETVTHFDARVIADAHGSAELRMLEGGFHELRHDPRALAILTSWLELRHSDIVRNR